MRNEAHSFCFGLDMFTIIGLSSYNDKVLIIIILLTLYFKIFLDFVF